MNKQVVSAGGLVYRRIGGGFSFLLVGSGRPIVWCIPKGMQESGENIEDTAVREVQEETGLITCIDSYVAQAEWSYEYNEEMWDETAHFFLLIPKGGNIEDHDSEFDVVEWVKADEAVVMLHYDNEKRIARLAIAELESRHCR